MLFSVRPNPNGSAERSAEIDRTGSAERSVNLAEPRTSQNTSFWRKSWPFSRKFAMFWDDFQFFYKILCKTPYKIFTCICIECCIFPPLHFAITLCYILARKLALFWLRFGRTVRPNVRWTWPNRSGSAEPRFWPFGRSLKGSECLRSWVANHGIYMHEIITRTNDWHSRTTCLFWQISK